jgi:hypothetical protein
MVDFPTRQNMTLNLFLTNQTSLVDKCTVAPGIIDYAIVLRTATASAWTTKPLPRKTYLSKKANIETITDQCRHLVDDFCHKYNTQIYIEDLWMSVKNRLFHLQDEHIPFKQSSTRCSQQWVNRDVKRISHRKKRSLRKAQKTWKAKNLRPYKRARPTCWSANNNYITNIVSPDSTSNPKKVWGLQRYPHWKTAPGSLGLTT